MNNTITRDDIKQLAANIEILAKDIQTKLDNNGDFLSTANELARSNMTFIFELGELYAVEKVGQAGATVKARPVNANYHNLRDNHGRFTKKI